MEGIAPVRAPAKVPADEPGGPWRGLTLHEALRLEAEDDLLKPALPVILGEELSLTARGRFGDPVKAKPDKPDC